MIQSLFHLIKGVINNAERKDSVDFFFSTYLKTNVPVEKRLVNIVFVLYLLLNVRNQLLFYILMYILRI